MEFSSYEERLLKSSPSRLAHLLQASAAASLDWKEEEYASILEHLLDCPSSFVSSGIGSDFKLKELFTGKASIEDIRHCKEWAKLNLYLPQPCMPHPLCLVVYYASIAKAVIGGQKDFTSLPPKKLAAGFQWCLQNNWLPECLSNLFKEATFLLTD